MELTGVHMCFGCGEKNPIGLKLKFKIEGETAYTEFTPSNLHQGYEGIVHGGIVSTLLDEAGGRLLYDLGLNAVTAQILVKFKRPAAVGEKICLFAEVTQKRGKIITTVSRASTEEGEILAEATTKFIRQ